MLAISLSEVAAGAPFLTIFPPQSDDVCLCAIGQMQGQEYLSMSASNSRFHRLLVTARFESLLSPTARSCRA